MHAEKRLTHISDLPSSPGTPGSPTGPGSPGSPGSPLSPFVPLRPSRPKHGHVHVSMDQHCWKTELSMYMYMEKVPVDTRSRIVKNLAFVKSHKSELQPSQLVL